MNNSDREVILKIKQGKIDYFEYIVRKYTQVMNRYIKAKLFKKEDSEDLVQNTFLSFYKAIHRFREEYPVLPYLYQIAKNELKMYYRAHKETVTLNEQIQIIDESVGFFQTDYNELIKKLTKEQRQILNMLIEGYSYREISDKIKKPLNTVRTIIRRTRLQIQKIHNENS